MIYLIFEIIFWLFIASIFGFFIGWFIKGQLATKEINKRRKSFEQELNTTREHFSETLLEMKMKIETYEQNLQERNELVHHMEEEYTPSGSTTARGQVIERPAVSKTATKPISQSHHSRDDLKKISGIGNFLEQRLNQLGIFRFEQIAKLGKKEIDSISSKIGAFPDRIIRDNWVDQARRLKK